MTGDPQRTGQHPGAGHRWQDGTARRDILVFTRAILPSSETFIQDHVLSLTRYRPILTGYTRLPLGLAVENCLTRTVSARASAADRLWKAFSPFPNGLDRIAREFRPVLVHAHFLLSALGLLPFLRRRRLPLVVTAHGSDVSVDPRRLRPADRLLLATRIGALARYVDQVICVSEPIRAMAIERGLPADKCVVRHLGVRPERFARLPAAPEPGRVLFVGRLVEKKGLRHLLRALALLKRRGVAAELHVVGDGPERAVLEAESRSLGLRAVFLGAQPRSRVEAELARSWLFAMPSHRAADGDSEGLPIVFLEAQAAGVPVVSFDTGPAREAIRDGVTGLLAPELDIGRLADDIGRLLTDRELRGRMSAQARAHVRNHFSLAARSAELERVYDDVVLRRARSPEPAAQAQPIIAGATR